MSFGKKILELGFLGMLGACAARPASKADIDEATAIYVDCLVRMARNLDDGRSPAMDVAVGVASACASERYRSAQLTAQGMNPQAQMMFMRKVSANGPSFAVGAVLRERRGDIGKIERSN
jgi:hypothetical protein